MVVLRYATAPEAKNSVGSALRRPNRSSPFFRYRDDDLKICAKCGKEFPNKIIIDGLKRDLSTRTKCLECLPFGIHPSVKNRIAKTYGNCAHCGKPLNAKGKKYCDAHCQHEHEYQEYIKRWKLGWKQV